MRRPLVALILMQLIMTALTGYAVADDSSNTSNTFKVDWPSPVLDSEHFGLLLFDLLEYESVDNSGLLNWDMVGWRGGDVNRIWVKSEGSYALSSPPSSPLPSPRNSEIDLQLLYGRLVTAFFDVQIGAKFEQAWSDQKKASRWSAALGLQGLSLYVFEIDTALFVSDIGHLAGKFSASKDFLFSQKSIAQLRVETNAAAQRSDEFETGSGINDLSLGLRFRYEVKREIAPYVGVNWSYLYGETADYRTRTGGRISQWSAMGGLRIWY